LNNNDFLKYQSPAHQRRISAGPQSKEPPGSCDNKSLSKNAEKFIVLAPSSAATTDDDGCSSSYESIHERETGEWIIFH
jgi:hypothetical protein